MLRYTYIDCIVRTDFRPYVLVIVGKVDIRVDEEKRIKGKGN